MYESLALALQKEGKHKIIFSVGTMGQPGDCIRQVKEWRFPIYTTPMIKADVMFVADPRGWPIIPNCITIEIPHGLAWREDGEGYYTPKATYQSNYFFAAGPDSANTLLNRDQLTNPAPMKSKVVITGMPKLDAAIGGERDCILVAPAYEQARSCFHRLIVPLLQLIEKGDKIAIKLHATIIQSEFNQENYILCHQLEEKGAIFFESGNIAPAFKRARIVISDASSAFLEAMGLGIPVILFNNEHIEDKMHPYLNRLDDPWTPIEYRFRKWATTIKKPEDLMDAISIAKPAPIEIQDQILSYKGTSVTQCMKALNDILS
jgi:hypothetical protein